MCVLCRADPHELQLEIEEVRSRQNSPKPWQERGGIIERGLYPFLSGHRQVDEVFPSLVLICQLVIILCY